MIKLFIRKYMSEYCGQLLSILFQNLYSKLINICVVVSICYGGQFSFMLSLMIIVLRNACLITLCCAGSICTTFPFRIWKRLYMCLLAWMVVFFKGKSFQMLAIPNRVYNKQIFCLLAWIWICPNHHLSNLKGYIWEYGKRYDGVIFCTVTHAKTHCQKFCPLS